MITYARQHMYSRYLTLAMKYDGLANVLPFRQVLTEPLEDLRSHLDADLAKCERRGKSGISDDFVKRCLCDINEYGTSQIFSVDATALPSKLLKGNLSMYTALACSDNAITISIENKKEFVSVSKDKLTISVDDRNYVSTKVSIISDRGGSEFYVSQKGSGYTVFVTCNSHIASMFKGYPKIDITLRGINPLTGNQMAVTRKVFSFAKTDFDLSYKPIARYLSIAAAAACICGGNAKTDVCKAFQSVSIRDGVSCCDIKDGDEVFECVQTRIA